MLREETVSASVCTRRSLVAVDLVEVNPSLAPANDIGAHETVRAGCSLCGARWGEPSLRLDFL